MDGFTERAKLRHAMTDHTKTDTGRALEAMPKALRLLADQITAPDHVPAMCLRDAAAMLESLAGDKRRLDWLENDDELFRRNLPITRSAIDAAMPNT